MLPTLQRAGHLLGSTLDAEKICANLLEVLHEAFDLEASFVQVGVEEDSPGARRSEGSEEMLDRVRRSPAAEEARRAATENKEKRFFGLQLPDQAEKHITGLCVPLETRGQIVGVVEVYGPDHLAEEKTIFIMDNLINQTTAALENARLYARLGRREQMLQDLVAKLLGAQEEERRRVAYEVHDGLAQVAAAAHQHLQAFARRYQPEGERSRADLNLIVRLVRRTVTDARQIIANLRPTTLDDFGLAAAISQERDNLCDDGYEVDYRQDVGEERLPETIEITLFRLVQEATTNLRKHADTRWVGIELARRGDNVYLEVRDQGKGFEPSEVQTEGGPGERVGLASMKERVSILGGTFDIISRPDEGTTVKVSMPLDRAESLAIEKEY